MSPHTWRRAFPFVLSSLLLAGCAGFPSQTATEATTVATAHDGNTAAALLEDFQRYQRLAARDALRERNALAAAPPTPATRLRLAMLWGLTGNPADLAKASALLNGMLKTSPTEAPELQPLARLLAAQYQERIKAEAQGEKLAQQLRESQRRTEELQEKLNAVAEIEQSIPLRPAGGKPAPISP